MPDSPEAAKRAPCHPMGGGARQLALRLQAAPMQAQTTHFRLAKRQALCQSEGDARGTRQAGDWGRRHGRAVWTSRNDPRQPSMAAGAFRWRLGSVIWGKCRNRRGRSDETPECPARKSLGSARDGICSRSVRVRTCTAPCFRGRGNTGGLPPLQASRPVPAGRPMLVAHAPPRGCTGRTIGPAAARAAGEQPPARRHAGTAGQGRPARAGKLAQAPGGPSIEVVQILLVEPGTDAPLSLQVKTTGPLPQQSFIRIRGLPQATSLSEGHFVRPGVWAVPLSALSTVRISVPAGQSGRSRAHDQPGLRRQHGSGRDQDHAGGRHRFAVP